MVILVLLLLPGCGGGSHSGATVVMKTDDVKAAYDASVAGLDRQYFDDMSMTTPTEMRQVLLVPLGVDGQGLAEWEADLATGATAARLTPPGRLSRVDVFEHSAGHDVPAEEEYGYGIQGSPVSTTHGSDIEIVAGVEGVLRLFHLTPTTVRLLHPLGPALVVEASTDDPASIEGRMGELESALDSGHSGLEGMYLAVDGPDGPLFRGESAHRIAEGGQWFARGFDSGIPHG